ncbi:peptidase S24 and S26 domain protein [Chloroherpeton thalassium ATCC 35110]|uniref:Peptidase S24 and S26 domain protein n=1 Tax=Chloroherpeton thalassium (strain ATCC 35110 / GB-78) TaxID=517418 RepID=B3QWZ6_CHLT3|nr:S24 family peptidase [Chloroherpeton thalassium]ACF13360.1 peptidase S24 and S26 domain protein [Chloroherpeton thalassium ATCC 35110]
MLLIAFSFGISQSSLSEIENGKFSPGSDIILSLCRYFNIDSNWLLTGTGKMFLEKKPESENISEAGDEPSAADWQLQAEQAAKTAASRSESEALAGDVAALKKQVNELFGLVRGRMDVLEDAMVEIPVFMHRVSAGPAVASSSEIEEYIKLPTVLLKHPKRSYAVRASGNSMVGAGIHSGDLLIVDQEAAIKHKCIVIASINGEQTVKRLLIEDGELVLAPENSHYQSTPITKEMNFSILGVVMHIIRTVY